MAGRIPEPLLPYIQSPKAGDLTVVTHVLGASANWVILQYLALVYGDVKTHSRYSKGSVEEDAVKETRNAVVLVSWMRDWEYWKTEARRSMGIDLAKAQRTGQFIFIDGLTTLSTCSVNSSPTPLDYGAPNTNRQKSLGNKGFTSYSSLNTIEAIYRRISEAIDGLAKVPNGQVNQQVLLILDSPNILLETYELQPTIVAGANEQTLQIDALQDLITHIRLKYQNMLTSVVVVAADDPLLAPAQNLVSAQHRIYRGGGNDDLYTTARETPLDRYTAALTMALAHQALYVIQCRKLDTGWAEDVTGVVRVTRGGAVYDNDPTETDGDRMATSTPSYEIGASTRSLTQLPDGEWLYHVSGDGSVKVWGRGSGN